MLAFILAFIFVVGATPVIKRLAHRLEIVDRPNRASKIHKVPIPLLGGLGIILIVMINGFCLTSLSAKTIGILVGGGIMAAIGILDDMNSLSYKVRLLIQTLAAGLMIFVFDIRFFAEGFDWLFVPLSFVWIVGLTNSFNFIDNMDGSSSGVALISAIGLAIIAFLHGNMEAFVIACSVAGGALGFLVFNFKPASIFLGDMGSLFLGFTLATTALYLSQNFEPAFASFAIFPFWLGLPIFDTSLVTWIRLRNGQPVYKADRSHVTFQFVNLGCDQRKAVIMEYTIAAILLVVSFLLYLTPFSLGWFLILFSTIVTLVFLANYFIHHDLRRMLLPSLLRTYLNPAMWLKR